MTLHLFWAKEAGIWPSYRAAAQHNALGNITASYLKSGSTSTRPERELVTRRVTMQRLHMTFAPFIEYDINQRLLSDIRYSVKT